MNNLPDGTNPSDVPGSRGIDEELEKKNEILNAACDKLKLNELKGHLIRLCDPAVDPESRISAAAEVVNLFDDISAGDGNPWENSDLNIHDWLDGIEDIADMSFDEPEPPEYEIDDEAWEDWMENH